MLTRTGAHMRAGQYISQSSRQAKYKAFIPNELPFKIKMDNVLQARLSEADQALGRLDGISQILPDVDFFVLMYISKEAILSSQVEGTMATFSDLLKAEARIEDAEIHSDVDEIQNYIEAMDYGLDRFDTLPLSLRLIRKIHAVLLQGVRGEGKMPGAFRKSQNWIGGHSIETASFVPPPAHEIMPLLHNLEKYMHDKNPAPLLIKTALIHLQFEAIHPFLDGNGRIGRLLITFFLCQQGVLKKPLLYLSEFFRSHRQEYYDRLSAAHGKDDLEGWLKFFLEGVALTARSASDTAQRVIELRECDMRSVAGMGAASEKALKLMGHLNRSPLVRIKDVERIAGLANPNAIVLIGKLAKLGILEEITGRKRNKIFAYSKYIDVFNPEKAYNNR
jgi:Fic family protein